MTPAPTPIDDGWRVQALRSTDLLDPESGERFDRVSRLARDLFAVRAAGVSLVDEHRQWFSSSAGGPDVRTPRALSLCGHVVASGQPLFVEDARIDDRFADNPLVQGDAPIVFYAGWPLRTASGAVVGTLCVLHDRPRSVSERDRRSLEDLAMLAQREIDAGSLAIEDPLTGLANRRSFEVQAKQALRACARFRRPASMALLDLRETDRINRCHGHAAGDVAVRLFGWSLRQALDGAQVIGRWGGDEFAVLMADAEPVALLDALFRLDEVLKQVDAGPGGTALRYAVGLHHFRPGGTDLRLEDGVRSAAQALARGKQRGTARDAAPPEVTVPSPAAATHGMACAPASTLRRAGGVQFAPA